jgi:hypothetical protein
MFATKLRDDRRVVGRNRIYFTPGWTLDMNYGVGTHSAAPPPLQGSASIRNSAIKCGENGMLLRRRDLDSKIPK